MRSHYADLIITNTTEKSHVGDQIWKQSETHLLTALLLYAWGLGGKKKAKEGGLSNLGHIRSLLRFVQFWALNKLITSNGIPEARDRCDEFVRNSSPNFRLGVFSGLIQRLNPWLNPKLIKLTEVSDFSQDDLRQNLFTFYLAYPVHRQDYKPIMSLALNFLTKLALRKTFEKPLTLLLDEFAAYGNIPGIDILQATIRNRGIGIVLGFQDQQQLQKVYTAQEAEVLFTKDTRYKDSLRYWFTESPVANKSDVGERDTSEKANLKFRAYHQANLWCTAHGAWRNRNPSQARRSVGNPKQA